MGAFSFCVSSVCLLVLVTVVDKNMALVCCLLATSAIMLSEKKKRKRKMCNKKWHLKRNISCDVHLLNGLLETDVPWDDAIVVWAGKLRKLWDSLSEPRSSVCERRLERTVLRPALLHYQNCTVYSVFPSGMTSDSKIAQFNWECIGRLKKLLQHVIELWMSKDSYMFRLVELRSHGFLNGK